MENARIEEELVALLIRENMTVATAESCTGGLLASKFTSVPGVSAVYAGGFVTYATPMKHALLGVSKKVLKEEGAIAKKTAKQMAAGAAEKTGVDCALSVTGNAGPSADEGKPVGLVYIGCCVDGKTIARKYNFEGDRASIREQAANAALELLLNKLTKSDSKKRPKKDKKK